MCAAHPGLVENWECHYAPAPGSQLPNQDVSPKKPGCPSHNLRRKFTFPEPCPLCKDCHKF